MIQNKRFTKLLNDGYRRIVLDSVSDRRKQDMRIPQYARYIIDWQVSHRNRLLKDDKNEFYGFQPVNFFYAVMKDGSAERRFFELRQVNHYLVADDREKAYEVMQAILIMWAADDRNILNFDQDKIKNDSGKQADEKA